MPMLPIASDTSLGTISNPYSSVATIPPPSSLPVGQYWCNKLAGTGIMLMQNLGGVWRPQMNSFSVFEGVDIFSVEAPGNTTPVVFPLFTIPSNFIKDGDKYRLCVTFFQSGANTGADLCEIITDSGGWVTSSGMVSAGQNFWVDAVMRRSGSVLERNSLAWSAANSSNSTGFAGNPANPINVSAKITLGNGGNRSYLRSLSYTRTA